MAQDEQTSKKTAANVLGSVEAEIEKGRVDSFKKKLSDKVRLLNEQKKAVQGTELEVKQMMKDFDDGKAI